MGIQGDALANLVNSTINRYSGLTASEAAALTAVVLTDGQLSPVIDDINEYSAGVPAGWLPNATAVFSTGTFTGNSGTAIASWAQANQGFTVLMC
jgi:hypothetical protein